MSAVLYRILHGTLGTVVVALVRGVCTHCTKGYSKPVLLYRLEVECSELDGDAETAC